MSESISLPIIPWNQYMLDLYRSQKPPVPLGTVAFEEIEEKAREKLKDYKGIYYAFGHHEH
jgi:lactate 2-monooxygenase